MTGRQTEKYLIGVDDRGSSQPAVQFAIAQAKASGADVLLVHVLEWSPYAFLTPTELEERHKRREEELERARTAILQPILDLNAGAGVRIETEIRYGHAAEILSEIAKEKNCSQIFVNRGRRKGLGGRIFGSSASSLAQISPIACTIVP